MHVTEVSFLVKHSKDQIKFHETRLLKRYRQTHLFFCNHLIRLIFILAFNTKAETGRVLFPFSTSPTESARLKFTHPDRLQRLLRALDSSEIQLSLWSVMRFDSS